MYAGISRTIRRCFAIIMSFFTHLIAGMMESPAERDRKTHAHLRSAKANADRLKAEWSQPTRSDGHWRSSALNAQQEYHKSIGRGSVGAPEGPAVGESPIDSCLHALDQIDAQK